MAKVPSDSPAIAHEEACQHELATTSVSPATAKALSILFCAALVLPAAVQYAAAVFTPASTTQPPRTYWPPTRDSLHALGESVGDHSSLKRWVQPRLQELLTKFGGFGNEKVVIGREGWLFYEPGIRSIFGQPFLDAAYLRSKAKAMIDKDGLATATPDPLPALRQLAADCRRLDIKLYLLPIPDKGTLMPGHLSGRSSTQRPRNRDFAAFERIATQAGATVLDVASYAGPGDSPLFLRQDTHWTPQFMDRVAQRVAAALHADQIVQPAGTPLFRLAPKEVTGIGDLVTMLKLTADQRLFPPETVQVQQVEPIEATTGQPPVLLLGDSFTNIYSSRSLEWGDKAGLGEHLAYHLNQPVEIVAQNGAGASVRSALLRAAKDGKLATTRALIYEFAERDLYLQDWPVVPLGEVVRSPEPVSGNSPPAQVVAALGPPPAAIPANTPELIVTGQLVQISRPINPVDAPYEDALLFGKVRIDKVEQGAYAPKEAIVVFLAMKGRQLQPGAGHSVGQSLRLKLIVMAKAPDEIRTMQRSDDTEDFDLAPYFVQAELP